MIGGTQDIFYLSCLAMFWLIFIAARRSPLLFEYSHVWTGIVSFTRHEASLSMCWCGVVRGIYMPLCIIPICATSKAAPA